MPEEEIPLTPIEQSRADTGYRFYLAASLVYDVIADTISEMRGFPTQKGRAQTVRALPLKEQLTVATDGRLMLAVSNRRIKPSDDELLSDPLYAGYIEEVVKADWEALKPEDEELI